GTAGYSDTSERKFGIGGPGVGSGGVGPGVGPGGVGVGPGGVGVGSGGVGVGIGGVGVGGGHGGDGAPGAVQSRVDRKYQLLSSGLPPRLPRCNVYSNGPATTRFDSANAP